MLSEFRVKYVNFIISRVVENWSNLELDFRENRAYDERSFFTRVFHDRDRRGENVSTLITLHPVKMNSESDA